MFSLDTPRLSPGLIKTRTRLLSVSTAMVLISTSAFAEDTGEAALAAYVDGLKRLGIELENGSVGYDAGSDTLTLKDSILSFSGSISAPTDDEEDAQDSADASGADAQNGEEKKEKALTYSLSLLSDTVTITGLTHEDDTFAAASWVYSDGSKMIATGAADGDGRFQGEALMTGMSVTNYSFTIPEIPAEDSEHQVSRWLPFVKTLLMASYEEARIDSTGMTFEAYATSGDTETQVLSGTAQLDGYLVSDVKEGYAGHYSFDRLVQDMQVREASTGEMVAQQVSQGKTIYKDMDFVAIVDLLDPSVPASDEVRTLLGSASAIDYKTTQQIEPGLDLTVNIDKSTMTDVTMVKRENNILTMLDEVFNKKEPSPEDLISNIFQLYRSFGVADSRVSGISLSVPQFGNDQDISINIREVAMTDLSSDGIGEMMIVGLDTPALPDGASVKLDWAAIGDIEFAEYSPMRAMIANLTADPGYGEKHPLEVARAFMPRSMSYEVEGLDINLPDVGRTAIGKAEMSISTTVPPIPTSFYLRNDGIEIPASSIDDNEAQELLKVLGLDTVVWSDETRLYWDEATLDLRLERLMLDIKGVGRVEASAHFGNVQKALFEDPEGQGQMAAVLATFVDASLVFNDDGVTSKGLTHIAQQEGIPENVFREALVAQAAQATAPIQNEAFTKMVSDAASAFLKDPKQLKITLTPAKPVPLAQILGSLAAPQSLPDLLNVNIVAN